MFGRKNNGELKKLIEFLFYKSQHIIEYIDIPIMSDNKLFLYKFVNKKRC